ncbi:MAG: hypothetical protein J6X33_03525 [Clostridiales bacterium]|nr:hypothetical protein [Clostridiales bacterium]
MAAKKRKVPVIVKILVGIVIFIVIVLLGARLYFRIPVSSYYQASDKGFKIPGLAEGLVPQGIAWDEDAKVFLVTGYSKDGSSTDIWRVDKETGTSQGRVKLQDEFGEDLIVHAGGLSTYSDYIYVASGEDDSLYVFNRGEVMDAKDGATVQTLGRFHLSTPDGMALQVAFTTVYDGKLVAGEFYREPNYRTPDSHKFTTLSGDYLQAVAFEYELSDSPDSMYGVEMYPCAAYALPDQVQGMAWQNGKIYTSSSYALAFSTIGVYDSSKLCGIGEFAGVPLYALDSSSKIKDIKFPPMSEEIEFVDGRMYTMCESASTKYFFGNLTGGQWCYATDMEALMK